MPFLSPTSPEALLPRSDSKNPSLTCRAITSSGRPCRRALPKSTLISSPSREHGPDDLPNLYCWQHKDQVVQDSTPVQKASAMKPKPLQPRTSLDTMVDRLCIPDLQDSSPSTRVQGVTDASSSKANKQKSSSRKAQKRKNLWSSLFCCITIDEEPGERIEIVRHRQRKVRMEEPSARPAMLQIHVERQLASVSTSPIRRARTPDSRRDDAVIATRVPKFSFPLNVTPGTASLLRKEAAKPISEFDEDGYIYMFWLTDSAIQAPPSTVTSTLLTSPSSGNLTEERRYREILRDFGTQIQSSDPSKPEKRLLLKIGRANNVHRRMNQWSRQCGYNLSLIRFYPYVPSKPFHNLDSTSPSNQPPFPDIRKVPYSHRVERLIHVELASKRMKQPQCAMCGKQHREWFEIEASKQGLKTVDDVVRRWITWAEGRGSS